MSPVVMVPARRAVAAPMHYAAPVGLREDSRHDLFRLWHPEQRPGTGSAPGCGRLLDAACPACGFLGDPRRSVLRRVRRGAPRAEPVEGAGDRRAPRRLPRRPVSERRLVSVLFVDLVGFTPFAEDRDPEEVRDTLARYVDLAATVIGRHGGTVEKFVGDAVMAVWGAPVAQEDDAERAVRAGLELVEGVGSLGFGFSARAGVTTGEGAVTVGAVGQGIVAGDIVNTAARLQGAAPPGNVLVGERRAGPRRGRSSSSGGRAQLKGKALPVAA